MRACGHTQHTSTWNSQRCHLQSCFKFGSTLRTVDMQPKNFHQLVVDISMAEMGLRWPRCWPSQALTKGHRTEAFCSQAGPGGKTVSNASSRRECNICLRAPRNLVHLGCPPAHPSVWNAGVPHTVLLRECSTTPLWWR